MNAVFRNLQGEVVETPAKRSYAVIRRACRVAAQSACLRPMHTGADAYMLRATQYKLAMLGVDAPHSASLRAPHKQDFKWGVAPDGTKRIRAVRGFGEIPHWDFTPAEPIETTCDVFA